MISLANTLRGGKLAAALTLTLCAMPVHADAPARSFADMVQTLPLVPANAANSEMLAKASEAAKFIKRMDLRNAHLTINEALQLDPRNSHLHFLNGFVYHLQALQGDSQKGKLAIEGYEQALRLDPSDWIAQEFLGMAHMDLKQFQQAKQAFSEALLLMPESTPSLSGLMSAAYLTGDARTACAMADQFLKAANQPSPGFLRSSITVYASCGNFARANWVRAALVQQFGESPELARIDRRLAQWKAFYASALQSWENVTASGHLGHFMKTQAFTAPDLFQQRNTPPVVDSEPTPSETVTRSENSTAFGASAGPRSLLVDVVLLSTQELMSTSKGVNLLNALTLQLGSVADNLPAYSRVVTSTTPKGGQENSSTSITRAVTVPALSYSLNIANANSSINEVLARPTLAAIEGQPSEFFSGVNLSAGVVSTSQEGGTTVVPLEKRFGISLAVTPTFLPQNRVQLKVEAQRTSLNASSENPRVAYQIEIGETTANANVVMNLGETLVLSGLSEKSSSNTRDGVPLLQDLPGIQYLFSNKRTNDLQRSVLILVTPRAPLFMAKDDAAVNNSLELRMQQLREKFDFADSIPANIEAVLTQLDSNDHYREFRQGDITLERWDRMRTTGDRLREAFGFLYY